MKNVISVYLLKPLTFLNGLTINMGSGSSLLGTKATSLISKKQFKTKTVLYLHIIDFSNKSGGFHTTPARRPEVAPGQIDEAHTRNEIDIKIPMGSILSVINITKTVDIENGIKTYVWLSFDHAHHGECKGYTLVGGKLFDVINFAEKKDERIAHNPKYFDLIS